VTAAGEADDTVDHHVGHLGQVGQVAHDLGEGQGGGDLGPAVGSATATTLGWNSGPGRSRVVDRRADAEADDS
jgi:hypothetical protein